MTVPPYAVAYVFTLLVAWSADTHNLYAHSSVQPHPEDVSVLTSSL